VKRGDLVTVAMQGDHGKPRPALIIQSDCFASHASVVVLPITSHLVDAPLIRISLEADKQTGLTKPSQIMIDKVISVRREKLGQVFGSIDHAKLLEVERSITVFLGIA